MSGNSPVSKVTEYATDKMKIAVAGKNAQQNLSSNATYIDYRTLDFSSVGLFKPTAKNNAAIGETLRGDRFALKKDLYTDSLRRWHQMTLYIGNSGIYRQNRFDSTRFYVISSNLPDSFSYSLSAEYGAPMEWLNNVSEIINLGFQIGTSGAASSKMKVADMKIWKGGKPLQLKLTIPVMDDAWIGANANGVGTNFNEALEILSSMCLPLVSTVGETDTAKLFSSLTYTPPPTPLTGTVSYKQKKEEITKDSSGRTVKKKSTENKKFTVNSKLGGITCQLGGMLLAENCVLTNMNVTYPNTKAMICHDYPSDKAISQNAGGVKLKYLTPIVAKLELTLETPFIMTQENYVKMLWLGGQANAANYSMDLTEQVDRFTAAGKEAINGMVDIITG